MPPPGGKRRGRQERTSLNAEERRDAGAFLQALVEGSGRSKRSVLAAMGYEGGTNRLNSYFRGERLPAPETLRAICVAIGASYVEVVDRFGYYREIIGILADLVWFGARWLQEAESRGKPMDAKRYAFGSWLQPERQVVCVKLAPIEFSPGETSSASVPSSLDCVDPSLSRETVIAPEHTTTTKVPKPIGLAIMLAVLAFPRRGDVYKKGARQYRERLAREAHHLVDAAECGRAETKAAGRPRNLPSYLQRACHVLDDPHLAFDSKRPVAGEYVQAWADSLCKPFTDYARLAAFEFFGVAGSEHSGEAASVVRMSPRPKVELPLIEALTSHT